MPTLLYRIAPSQLGDFERRFGARIREEMKRGLQRVGKQVTAYLKSKSSDIKDLGLFGTSWVCQPFGLRVHVYNTAPYAIYVELGRRAGKKPPPYKALAGWCQRKLGDAKLAYVVARSIGRNGIKARPVLNDPTTQAVLVSMVDDEMDDIWVRAAKGAV